jgi:zinc transport system substrate-binding protein
MMSYLSRALRAVFIISLNTAVLIFGICCEDQDQDHSSELPAGKPLVYTSNYPLFYFSQRIGGDLVETKFLAPADGDPAFWNPGEADILAMQSGDLLLLNGADYEKWLANTTMPLASLVNTSKAFSGEYLASGEAASHSHGPEGEHSHAGTAFTTWMDLQQAIWQAEEIRDALIKKLPEAEPQLQANFDALADDIDTIHARFKEIGQNLKNTPLLASHPVYQYFARRYTLDIESVLWEPETVPDDAAMEELKRIRGEHPGAWMIWEGAPAEESIAKLQAIGIHSVVVDPCGNRPDAGDWLSVMQANADNLGRITP